MGNAEIEEVDLLNEVGEIQMEFGFAEMEVEKTSVWDKTVKVEENLYYHKKAPVPQKAKV